MGVDQRERPGRDADREGIDRLVFFPSVALGLPGFTDLAFAAEFARLYNRWLAGYCREAAGRAYGVAVLPLIISAFIPGTEAIRLGGTSVLIVVSVVVETMKQLEAQMMMRNYEGFIR